MTACVPERTAVPDRGCQRGIDAENMFYLVHLPLPAGEFGRDEAMEWLKESLGKYTCIVVDSGNINGHLDDDLTTMSEAALDAISGRPVRFARDRWTTAAKQCDLAMEALSKSADDTLALCGPQFAALVQVVAELIETERTV